MSLITTAQAANYVGCDESDPAIKVIHPAVEKQLNIEKGWTLESADHTWVTDGSGTNKLFLPNTPVTAVTSIAIRDYGTVEAGTGTGNEAYYVWSAEGELTWRYGVFERGHRNITVVYTGGYTTSSLPANLYLWICEVCKAVYDRHKLSAEGVSDLKLGSITMKLIEVTQRPDLIKLRGPKKMFC